MLHILMAATRRAMLRSFTECLSSDGGVGIDWVASRQAVLDSVRRNPPHLVIIDSELPAVQPLKLVAELLQVDAMVNAAVMSPLPEDEFHREAEGLGVLVRLPVMPEEHDAEHLLRKLKNVLGITG